MKNLGIHTGRPLGSKGNEQKLVLSVLMFTLLLISCNRDNNHPGWAYFPDMAYSNAYETYSENPNFADGRTLRMPVPGTISREMIIYPYPKTFEAQQQAGLELINPVPLTGENLKRGKFVYDIYCSSCHGEAGKGDGYLVKRKLFTAQPIVFTDDYLAKKPDGELYHVITLGSLSGLMGPHGSQLKPDDRWKVTRYIRNRFSVNL